MGLLAGLHQHRPAGVVNLDGQTISFADPTGPPWSAIGAVKVDADGTMTEEKGGIGSGHSQIDGGTGDWVTPASEAPGLYEVFATLDSEAGDGLTSGTTGSWIDCDTSPIWACSVSAEFATASATITLAIRLNGGSTLDTGVYNLHAEAGL